MKSREVFTMDPALIDEFGAEHLAEMMALRARIHASDEPTEAKIQYDEPALLSEAKIQYDEPALLSEAKIQTRTGPTGPRSIQGKTTSSANSLKHGLASGRIIIPGEDPADFDALLSDLVAEHAPATETEQLLVQHMAQSWWLLQRAIRLQNQAFTETRCDVHKLALFLRYQTTHERAFYRALNSLLKLQKERHKANPEFVSQKPAVAQAILSPVHSIPVPPVVKDHVLMLQNPNLSRKRKRP
jgi:hypothetical protein